MAAQGVRVRITDNGMTFWLAFMAFLTSLSAASVMTDVLGNKGSALLLAIVGGLQASTAVLNARLRPLDEAHEQGRRQAQRDMRASRLRHDP